LGVQLDLKDKKNAKKEVCLVILIYLFNLFIYLLLLSLF
jgi:hypothetical protein